MKKIYKEATKNTPKLVFDAEQGILSISGTSSPENPMAFYSEFFNALDDLVAHGKTQMKVTFDFVYFNTSSSRCMYEVLKKLKNYQKNNSNKVVDITWYYEADDEDMKEIGEDIQDLLDIPFNIKKK